MSQISRVAGASLSSELPLAESYPSLPPPLLRLENLLGRLIEFSGSSATATLTVALRCVREAQQLREPVCWVTPWESHFFPPDAAAGGIDLESLVVVRLTQMHWAPRAADLLVRSGGFGLVVLDFSRYPQPLSLAVFTRLAALARKHSAALLFLTEKLKERPSLSSLVSLRVEAQRKQHWKGEWPVGGEFAKEVLAENDSTGRAFGYEIHVLKDKRPAENSASGRLESWGEICGVPDGLC